MCTLHGEGEDNELPGTGMIRVTSPLLTCTTLTTQGPPQDFIKELGSGPSLLLGQFCS